jgi:hypothetical protein
LITKISFFKKSGLTPAQLIIIFLLKIVAGIFYGWIGVYYGEMAKMVDTWGLHYEGLRAYEVLKSDPSDFFPFLFENTYNDYRGFFSDETSWWNDLHNNSFIMILSLFDALSYGSYYINVIFYSFLTLFGPIAIYRVMRDAVPSNNLAILIGSFLLPSFIYWCSGLNKDGLVYDAFGLIIYNFYFGLKNRRFSVAKTLLIILGFVLLLLLRNYLLVIILPALAGWLLSKKMKARPVITFSFLYLIFALLFFGLRYINPKFDLPQAVVNKQQSFLNLKGGAPVPVKKLEPSFPGFLKNLPQAVTISSIRPYPSDIKHLLSFLASAEINLLLLCFFLFLFFRRNIEVDRPFLLFCLFFSFSILLTIGYTVNFLGAVVRYRSLVLPILLTPILALTDWQRIFRLKNTPRNHT